MNLRAEISFLLSKRNSSNNDKISTYQTHLHTAHTHQSINNMKFIALISVGFAAALV